MPIIAIIRQKNLKNQGEIWGKKLGNNLDLGPSKPLITLL
jgi:hypothetical protein